MASRFMTDASDARRLLSGLVRVADIAVVVASGVLGYWVRHHQWTIPTNYLVGIAIAAILTANVMQLGGIYDLRRTPSPAGLVGQMLAGWTGIVLVLIVLAYFTKTSDEFSRVWLLIWIAISLAGMLLVRSVMFWQLDRWRRAGYLKTRIAIVGANDTAGHLLRQLRAQSQDDYEIVGIYDERVTRVPRVIEGLAVAGSLDDLARRFREQPFDEILITVPWQASERIADLVKRFKTFPVNVRLCPEAVAFQLPFRGYGLFAGVPMLGIFERPLAGWGWLVKAVEDRLIAAIVLILVLPLLGLVALLIKLDSPGPVLFAQKRYGFNNNEFRVFKFRTMAAEVGAAGDVRQAMPNDPRVTRVGAFLRRTSLDELPQIFNVLRGDMSLVGPRPHAIAHNEAFADMIDDYLSRHRVKPGITGWAQVNGLRGQIDSPSKIQMRVQYDLYYIDNWSLLLDLKILLMTFFVGFIHKNAY